MICVVYGMNRRHHRQNPHKHCRFNLCVTRCEYIYRSTTERVSSWTRQAFRVWLGGFGSLALIDVCTTAQILDVLSRRDNFALRGDYTNDRESEAISPPMRAARALAGRSVAMPWISEPAASGFRCGE